MAINDEDAKKNIFSIARVAVIFEKKGALVSF